MSLKELASDHALQYGEDKIIPMSIGKSWKQSFRPPRYSSKAVQTGIPKGCPNGRSKCFYCTRIDDVVYKRMKLNLLSDGLINHVDWRNDDPVFSNY